MFVPVTCTNCGKPFQVPETALGKLAPCPWCEAVVTALPVATAQPQAEPQTQSQAQTTTKPQAAEAPLPLDDEPPAGQAPKPATTTSPAPTAAIPVAPPVAKRSKPTLATVLIGALVVVVVAAATMIVRGYGSGRMSEVGWIDFTPPDGSFTIAMPSQPKEEDVEPNPEGSVTGGKRYSVREWYSKAGVWVAYTDLTPALLPKLKSDPHRSVAAGVLRVERDREVARLKGKVEKEVERRLNNGWGVELHIDTPTGNAIVWLILMGEGQHPRLYSFGVEGKNLTPTTPAVAKVFGSFRVND
jgi:hypothetical protein